LEQSQIESLSALVDSFARDKAAQVDDSFAGNQMEFERHLCRHIWQQVLTDYRAVS
jgi:hypothetical protein